MKYEQICLIGYRTLPALRENLKKCSDKYKHWRLHEKLVKLNLTLIYQVPPETRESSMSSPWAANLGGLYFQALLLTAPCAPAA